MSNHDPAVIGEPNQAPLLQSRQQHLDLLHRLLILLKLGIGLIKLSLELLFALLILLLAVLILGDQTLQLINLV